jgi:hypothetical protein
MSREVRRVPADWQHPRWAHDELVTSQAHLAGRYQPCVDADYESACREWYADAALWCRGEHPDQQKQPRPSYLANYRWYHEWHAPPHRKCHRERAWTPEEATHYQVYETVTEGTPITPVFATLEEMVEHLVRYGTDWDDDRAHPGWDRAAAVAFAGAGHAMSAVVGPSGFAGPQDGAFWDQV